MIEFKNVTKSYGKTKALCDFSLTLAEDGIYCLLGRNGAGKTTFMNLISGKIVASAGEVVVCGKKVDSLNMPENVRYIEAAKPQFNMRVEEHLALAKELDEKFDAEFAEQAVKKFRLDKKKKYNALSFGMKTMVTTVLSLASNDDIVLLDEPVLGFDAVMRKEFYELLTLSFEKHPRIIVVSTHLIDEIANVAHKIVMIDGGKLILNESAEVIAEKAYKISGTKDAVDAVSAKLNVLATENIGKFKVAYIYDKRIAAFNNIDVEDLSLQDLFIKFAECGGEENE